MVMEEKQIKLLKALAKKIESKKRERAVVMFSLKSAKILTKEENFTGHLKNLDKVFATAE